MSAAQLVVQPHAPVAQELGAREPIIEGGLHPLGSQRVPQASTGLAAHTRPGRGAQPEATNPSALRRLSVTVSRLLDIPGAFPGQPTSVHLDQSRFDAMAAPSDIALSLAHTTSSCPTREPIPQSVPVWTFSRPTRFA
jgi:hypothetical protein